MAEHYDAETLRISRDLYDKIRTWGQSRGGVTLIGGWAVSEHVTELRAQQSRDVDLILHDNEALLDFDRQLKEWGLQWRTSGRNRFNDCHLIGEDPRNIRVDVFKGTNFEERLFRGPRARMADFVKAPMTKDWLPNLEYLIRDKLETISKRVRDREDKRLKDFIDLHNLAFHNREGKSARDLAASCAAARAKALGFLDAAREHDDATRGGVYAEELRLIGEWLAA